MAGRDYSLIQWPEYFSPRGIELHANAPVNSGPPPALGAPARVMNDAGLWRLSWKESPIHGWRTQALRSLLLNGITTSRAYRVPVWDYRHAAAVRSAGVPFSNLASFSNEALFAGPAPTAIVAVAAAADLTRITLTVPTGTVLQPGHIIGAGDRAYFLWNVEIGTTTTTVSFWPKLREPLALGEVIELAMPHVRMNIERDSVNQTLGDLDLGIFGTVSLNFIEDTWS